MDSNNNQNKIERTAISFGDRNEEVEFNSDRDRIFTFLTMSDYDWMSYKLCGEIPLKGGRLMTVIFEYDGFVQSEMSVKIDEEEIQYKFPAEIFKKYLKKYLEAEIKCFHSKSAFYGGNLILEFYEAVVGNEFSKEHREKAKSGENGEKMVRFEVHLPERVLLAIKSDEYCGIVNKELYQSLKKSVVLSDGEEAQE